MDGLTIYKLMKKHPATKTIFIGIYAKDYWPRLRVNFPQAYIFNTAKLKSSGIFHWVAVYFVSKTKAEFFDSFGHTPTFYGLNHFFNSIHSVNTVVFNSLAIQPLLFLKCALYAMFFIIQRCKKISILQFINIFDTNQSFSNDVLILKKFPPEIEHKIGGIP